MTGVRICALVFFMEVAGALGADSNSVSPEQIPALLPPRGELAPSFWEQYGWRTVAGGVAGALVVGAGAWFLLRPRPVPPVAPEVRARQELEPLRQQPEDGALLSRVSQAVRRYIAAAFSLPPEELTTTEFCRLLGTAEQVGPELSASAGEFLRECDRRKFALAPPQTPLAAVPRALELVEMGEARRAKLREEEGEKSVS